jgi:hypothetical protein
MGAGKPPLLVERLCEYKRRPMRICAHAFILQEVGSRKADRHDRSTAFHRLKTKKRAFELERNIYLHLLLTSLE